MITIFHNSRCLKSRQCLSLIENSSKKFEVIKYLEIPPTIDELTEIISKLESNYIKSNIENINVFHHVDLSIFRKS